jgi:uncharacterized protein YbaR (Trm112 family)
MPSRTYQILEVGLTLEASDDNLLGLFHRDYARFEAAALPAGNRLAIRYQAAGPGSGPWLEVDGVRESLAGHPRAEAYAAQVAARTLMERVRAFTVLHAAVLGKPGGALALSGPPGAGKTTLALALLARGWAYYSDDFCPLHRETGLVHAFPRSVWVRPAPGEGPGDLGRNKTLFPMDGVRFPVGGPPLPLRWLMCLGGEPATRGKLSLRLRQGRAGTLLAALGGLEGVLLSPADSEEAQGWTVSYPVRDGIPRRVREVLREHPEAAWNVFSLPEAPTDFAQEPSLTPLPTFEAAFFLLRELKQDLAPGLPPGALLSHLGELLADVACFRLTPGPLDRCLALVQTVAGAEVPA